MKILVCIKQVPDKDAKLVLDASGSGIVETQVSWEVNEPDRFALETGLRLREARGDGEVIACTIGPERARKALQSALAMGCDRAIHLVDPDFQNGDPMANARALAAVAGKEEAELVLCGSRSDDAGYGQTPMLLAGLLERPAAFLTIGVSLEGETLEVVRELEATRQETFNLELPAVLSIQSGISDVRYTSLKGIMAAKKKPVVQPSPAELGLSVENLGSKGSRLTVLGMAPPTKSSQCEFIEGDPATAAKDLFEKLRRDAKVF